MDSFDTLSNFVNQEADYNFASGLELVKKQGGLQVPIPESLNQMWQSVREPVMGAAQSVDKALTWPMQDQLPKVAEAVTGAMFPESPKEALVGGIAGLQPGMASWQETFSKVGSLSNRLRNAVPDRKALEALEALTESMPSVRNAELNIGQSSLGSSYTQNMRDIYNSHQFAQGLFPGTIEINVPHFIDGELSTWQYPLERSPWLSYAHEGPLGHALTSGSLDIRQWMRTQGGMANPMKAHARAAIEGFAEGGSHGVLDKYNKNVFAPYWGEYKGQQPLEDIYTTAGALGVDVGNMARRGFLPDQEDVIDTLLRILKDKTTR